MTQSNYHNDVFKKWSDAIGATGFAGSEDTSFDKFMFPMIKQVAFKPIASDLIFASKDEINEAKNRIQSENREGKIDSVVNNKDFVEKKLEDDEEYQKLIKKGISPIGIPQGQLFYIDYKYGEIGQRILKLKKIINCVI